MAATAHVREHVAHSCTTCKLYPGPQMLHPALSCSSECWAVASGARSWRRSRKAVASMARKGDETRREARGDEREGRQLQVELLLLASRFFALPALDCGFPCTNLQGQKAASGRAIYERRSTSHGEANPTIKRFVFLRGPSLCYQHNSRGSVLC